MILKVLLVVLASHSVLIGNSECGVAVAHASHIHGKEGTHKERVVDGAYSPRDAHHHNGGQHDSSFDHEAIIGSAKEAAEFDNLSPREAKERLTVLVGKMDRNKDGSVDRKELFSWILRSFRSLSLEESSERFQDTDEDNDGFVTWTEYKSEEFELEEHEGEETLASDPDRAEELSMYEEDKILFDAADVNHDGRLDSKEFLSFSHPEEDPKMIPPVVAQTLKSKDTDHDGLISFQEFVGTRGKDQTKEWLKLEKERFDMDLDRNKDGHLDQVEIGAWIIPSNDEIAEDEVNHLFAGADDDVDGILSLSEILDHHELFVGSEATDYGEHLNNPDRFTDEL